MPPMIVFSSRGMALSSPAGEQRVAWPRAGELELPCRGAKNCGRSGLNARCLLHGSYEASCPGCEPCAHIAQRSAQSASRAARAAMAWRRRASPGSVVRVSGQWSGSGSGLGLGLGLGLGASPRACRWALSTTSQAGPPSQSYSSAYAAPSWGCGARGGYLAWASALAFGLRRAHGDRRTRCLRRGPCGAG
eukprot:scaffold43507_cov56-Phaeocystis_antarctica.AAC.4